MNCIEAKDLFEGGQKMIEDKKIPEAIRGREPELIAAAACAQDHCPLDSRGLPRLQIAPGVSDHPGRRKIQVEIVGSPEEQSGFGFTTVTAFGRRVRAHKNAIQPASTGLNVQDEALVDLLCRLQIHQAPSDRGLVGDDHDAVFCQAWMAKRPVSLRDRLHMGPLADVVVTVLDQNPVAVEEDGGKHRAIIPLGFETSEESENRP